MATIHPLSEGVFTVGHDKQFVPFNENTEVLTDRPTGSLLVEVQPFLVVTEKDVMILDTGLGFREKDGELQIRSNLKKCGYEPEEVTKVLLSHLHKDHVNGAVYSDLNGIVHTTFPSADYFIYRAEADYALQHEGTSYPKKEVEELLSSKQVKWLDGEEGFIDGYIKFMHSGAHCPQHIVFLIDDGTDKLFYGGDEAPQLKQMKMRYIARYDYDGKKAMALREEYAKTGKEQDWQFLFYHDVKTPVAKL